MINTARGNVVDVPALVRALADGKLRSAGLDVLPQEPLIREEAQIFRADAPSEGHDLRALVANHVLLRFPNVIVTPHNAYNTQSAVRRKRAGSAEYHEEERPEPRRVGLTEGGPMMLGDVLKSVQNPALREALGGMQKTIMGTTPAHGPPGPAPGIHAASATSTIAATPRPT